MSGDIKARESLRLNELKKRVSRYPRTSQVHITHIMAPRRSSEQTVLKPPADTTLRFREDGTFHIGVFEDLHFAEGAL